MLECRKTKKIVESVFNMKIIDYEEKYRDDMIFMVLEAKNALGRKPRLNEDLLDIDENYTNKGGRFILCIDDSDRVIGCVGYSLTDVHSEACLHRLYVKYSMKRKGIGSALLKRIEEIMTENGIDTVRIHLGDPEIYYESYSFYPKYGYTEYEPSHMIKSLK